MRDYAARFRFLTEALPLKIFTADSKGEIDYYNHHWSEYTGLPPGVIIRLGWREFVHPGDLDEKVRLWKTAIASGEPFRFEHRFRRHDGAYRWHVSQAEPYRDQNGDVMLWIGFNSDVDDIKRAQIIVEERSRILRGHQQELQMALAAAEQARAEAEAAARTKDDFLSILSHELRTPLTPVLMAVGSLRSEPGLSPAAVEALDMIERNVESEARLISDLLELTRVTRATGEFMMEPTDLHSAVRLAGEACESELMRKGLKIEFSLNAGRHDLVGDASRLHDVFRRLFRNAIRATPSDGRIQVESYNVGNRIRVALRDTGSGINPEILSRIFDPFDSSDTRTGRHLGSLGLSLAICRAILHAHGGTLSAGSEGEGRGAVFTIELDTLDSVATPAPPEAGESEG